MAESARVPAFMVDVDGTLALHPHRGPFDWQHADRDVPNAAVIAVIRALAVAGYAIVYVSGRPDDVRSVTLGWLQREVGVPGPLFMRPSKDFRKDAEVKLEMYRSEIEAAFDVVAVLDDRDQVVKMWREVAGLQCFQVAPGAF